MRQCRDPKHCYSSPTLVILGSCIDVRGFSGQLGGNSFISQAIPTIEVPL